MLLTIVLRTITFILRIFTFCVLLIGGAFAAEPVTADPVQFKIEPQPLGSALTEFARQSDRELLFASDIVEGKQAQTVAGVYEPEEALTQLLADSGLEYSVTANDTILVAEEERGDRDRGNGRTAGTQKPVMMAQNQTAPARRRVTEEEAEGEKEPERPLEEIVVTGTHIRGVQETAAPLITITREQIEQTGYTKVEDIFEDLPQNLAEFRPESIWSDGSSVAARQNSQGVSGISLRGLGAGSTLTLINGIRRAPGLQGRAVDVATIPLSMIERVDVLTGGASAIYGSDAVAGVVNLTTRREFQGMETLVSASDSAHPGGERLQFSHIMGFKSGRGSLVAGYDYSKDKHLDLLDTGVPRFPSPSGTVLYHVGLQPDRSRHSVMLSGRFEASEQVELYADGMYAHKDQDDLYQASYAPGIIYSQGLETKTEAFNFSLGARTRISAAWTLDVSTARAVSDADYQTPYSEGDSAGLYYNGVNTENDRATMTAASAVLDGPLFTLGEMTARAAFGADYRKEGFDDPSTSSFTSGGETFTDSSRIGGDRNVRAAFAELSLPLVTDGENRGMRRLELSLGARHDRYSDFGKPFNYHAAIIWQPVDEVTVRGTFATAYRAPELWYLYGAEGLRLSNVPDPATGGNSIILIRRGNGNSSLTAEEADTWSLGFDWKPSSWATLSLSYFSIDYTNRIDRPIEDTDATLIDEAKFVDLVDRDPAHAELQALLEQPFAIALSNQTGVFYDPTTGADGLLSLFPNVILVDARTTNVAVEKVHGIDLQLDAQFDTAYGELSFGFNGAYSLDHDRRITETSPAIDQLNRIGKPVDLRLRATTGWTRGFFGAFLGVNYKDSYADNFALLPSGMDSWTTVDLNLRLDGSKLGQGSFFEGATLSLSADNLFDENPPVTLNDNEGIGYDSVNANALGRLISVRLQKRW